MLGPVPAQPTAYAEYGHGSRADSSQRQRGGLGFAARYPGIVHDEDVATGNRRTIFRGHNKSVGYQVVPFRLDIRSRSEKDPISVWALVGDLAGEIGDGMLQPRSRR